MASYYKGNRNVKKEHYELGILLTEKKKIEILKEHFESRVGYELNLDEPKSFNEKIMWSKLYYQNPLLTKCCDKYAVKDYVTETIGDEYIIPTIAHWDRPEDIDFDKLPEKFALKVNWSSGYNIICRNKADLDISETIEQLKKWMTPDRNSYYQFFNWGYKHMKPVIYAEQYIEQIKDQVYDYKFFVFDGKVRMMFIATDRYDEKNQLTHDFFDRDFNHLPFRYGGICHAESLPDKPKNFEKMVELAEKLAAPFPFMRVDFYEISNKIYVGEMTFYPGGGILSFEPAEWDYIIGEWYQLPPKMITDKQGMFYPICVAAAQMKYSIKENLKKIRMKIVDHNVINKCHYITVFGKIRFPFSIYSENGYKYVSVQGMEVKYKREKEKKSQYISLPDPEFDPLPPRIAYAMEDKITIDMKKHYCEQKAFKQLKYFPNLDHPKSFNEKLLWLALYYKNPHHKVASDKARAKEWIGSRIGYEYVVPLIGAYSNVNEIDFKRLPNKFVMKANDGWGADEVILVKDKKKCNLDHLKALASSWLYPWCSYYYQNMCITDGKPERPLIVVEELLEQENKEYLDDYKLYCCNGKVEFALIVNDRGSSEESRTFVDVNWNVLPVRRAGKISGSKPLKPKNYEKMIELAEILASEVPFVRIDFYNLDGKLYVGEMTFTPGLFLRFEPQSWDLRLGEYLDISELMKEHDEQITMK